MNLYFSSLNNEELSGKISLKNQRDLQLLELVSLSYGTGDSIMLRNQMAEWKFSC